MNLPQYLYGSNDELHRYFALLVQQLQSTFTSYAWSQPEITSAEVATIINGTVLPYFTPVLPVGSFWYNTTLGVIQVIVQAAVLGASDAAVMNLGYSGLTPFPWTVVSANTAMAVNNGYMTSSGGTLLMALPTVAAVGDVIEITNLGGNFQITQSIGQSINFGDDTTTVGVGGSITSMRIGDTIEVVCYFANTGFQVIGSVGNFTIV